MVAFDYAMLSHKFSCRTVKRRKHFSTVVFFTETEKKTEKTESKWQWTCVMVCVVACAVHPSRTLISWHFQFSLFFLRLFFFSFFYSFSKETLDESHLTSATAARSPSLIHKFMFMSCRWWRRLARETEWKTPEQSGSTKYYGKKDEAKKNKWNRLGRQQCESSDIHFLQWNRKCCLLENVSENICNIFSSFHFIHNTQHRRSQANMLK